MKDNKLLIKVIGVGGCGCNTVSNIEKEYAGKLGDNFEFYGVDTDFISLANQSVSHKVQIGSSGIGTAKDPMKGAEAAQKSINEIKSMIQGVDIAILCAGLSGGTGSGATGVIAQAAAGNPGCVVMASVTLPFYYDDQKKQEAAKTALKNIKEVVPVVLPVQNGVGIEDENVPFLDVLRATDRNVISLLEMIKVITSSASTVSLDFSEFLSVASTPGNAMIGIGEADGEQAVSVAISLARSPKNMSYGDYSLKDASKMALVIMGNGTISYKQIKDARTTLQNEIGYQTEVFNGLYVNNELEKVKVIMFATGMNDPKEVSAPVYQTEMTDAGPGDQVEMGFLAADEGYFKGTAPAYFEGINYDRPTFLRKNLRIEQ